MRLGDEDRRCAHVETRAGKTYCMSDLAPREEPLQFGDGGKLFGILTTPAVNDPDVWKATIFVFLNAGMLHRTGPHGLYVRLSRELAEMGFGSLRVDLAGIGDSPPRTGMNYRESVSADFKEILGFLESELGTITVVLVGLCSGADNAIRLALEDTRVVGMILLDPVCSIDHGFKSRAVVYSAKAFAMNCITPSKYIPWLKRRLKFLTGRSVDIEAAADNLSLRDLPTPEQTRLAITTIRQRGGKVFAAFTGYALQYCNEAGQMARTLQLDGGEENLTELFWPEAAHTYELHSHRARLIEEIKAWAKI